LTIYNAALLFPVPLLLLLTTLAISEPQGLSEVDESRVGWLWIAHAHPMHAVALPATTAASCPCF
jgi:hypothetical protein